MGSYYLAALLLVIAIPVVALALAVGGYLWARDAMERGGLVGGVGVVVTLVAVGNLLVERSCAGGVNRPIITAFLSRDDCQPPALAAVELVVLLVVATALAPRLAAIRR